VNRNIIQDVSLNLILMYPSRICNMHAFCWICSTSAHPIGLWGNVSSHIHSLSTYGDLQQYLCKSERNGLFLIASPARKKGTRTMFYWL